GAETTTYEYDSVGNLSGVRLANGTQIDYVLDANGRRLGKRVNGALVQAFLNQDGARPIAELDGAGIVVSRFVYVGSNVPAYMNRDGATYRIITDQLGSPRLVVDVATGAIAQRLDYDTFGNVILDTNPGFQPFGFAGGLYDRDTRLIHFGAREYDPETGRWTARDPSGFGAGPNLYEYAHNNPVNLVDPLGNAPVDPFDRTPMPTGVNTSVEAAEAEAERVLAYIQSANRNFFRTADARSFNGSIFSDSRIPFGTNQVSGTIGGNFRVTYNPILPKTSKWGPICEAGG